MWKVTVFSLYKKCFAGALYRILRPHTATVKTVQVVQYANIFSKVKVVLFASSFHIGIVCDSGSFLDRPKNLSPVTGL